MRGFLKSDDICDGSAIDLSIREMVNSWDVYHQDESTVGRATLPWNPDEVDFLGVGNQTFKITGHFVEGSVTEPNTGSVEMSTALIGSFCNIGSPSWFILDAAYFLAGTASIQVIPTSPKIKHNFDAEEHADFNITLIETSDW